MSNELIPLDQIERMGTIIAQSGLFGAKKPQEAIALCLLAQAFGMHPAMAAQDFDIIQGRPAKKSDAMLRTFLENGGKVQWHKLDDTIADATFSHPAGGELRINWDMNRAKQAGLGGKDMWKKYPRQMLRARCISEGVRSVYPAATSGLYVPEEIKDFDPEKDVTPELATKPVSMPEKVKEMAKKLKETPPKAKPQPIEGTFKTITGDPSESDLAGIGSPAVKAPEEQVIKLVKAFFDIGMGVDAMEEFFGKSVDDFTDVDVAKARTEYKKKKQEFVESQSSEEI